jgi:hypothetical protein
MTSFPSITYCMSSICQIFRVTFQAKIYRYCKGKVGGSGERGAGKISCTLRFERFHLSTTSKVNHSRSLLVSTIVSYLRRTTQHRSDKIHERQRCSSETLVILSGVQSKLNQNEAKFEIHRLLEYARRKIAHFGSCSLQKRLNPWGAVTGLHRVR